MAIDVERAPPLYRIVMEMPEMCGPIIVRGIDCHAKPVECMLFQAELNACMAREEESWMCMHASNYEGMEEFTRYASGVFCV
jgi:hypothetical protein